MLSIVHPIVKLFKTSRLVVLSIFLVIFCLQLQAKNYYISSSSGNDTYTSTQAQNPATPWKTIAMINSFFRNILPGDTILFKRGDVFYGSLNVLASGIAGRPITISAYSTGNKPVISGFKLLTNWTPTTTAGINKATITGINNTVNLVCINDQPQRIGRYPNSDDTNGGYLNYEIGSNTFITDNQLQLLPNWSGAELVIRKARHEIERWPITSQVGTTLNYQANSKAYLLPSYVSNNNGYGYFIQKDLRCLDKFGEWFYDTKDTSLKMFFGSTNTANYSVKISTVNILINVSSYSHITVADIAFEGANVHSIDIGALTNSSSNVIVKNCDFYNSGGNSIHTTNSSRITVQNCNINNSYNNAVLVENEGGPSSFINIARNNIKNTGIDPGMGPIYGISCQGITIFASDATIEYNNIDSSGYLGIAFYFNNAKVRNNYITNFAFVKDDGGGIYSWTGPVGGPVYSGREVKNNILVNGIGAGFGTPNGQKTAYGIYMDDGVVGVDISGNSVTNCAEAGLYMHNSHEVNITNNTVYNCGVNQMLYAHDNITPTDPIRNVLFKKNIMVAKTADQLCFNFRTIKDDINLSGPTDSNYFARPTNDDITIGGTSPVIKTTYSLERWKSNFPGKDVRSKKSSKIILPYKLNKLNTSNLLTNGDFLTGITGISFWSQNNNQLASWDNTSKLTGTGSLRLSFPTVTPNIYTICTKSGLGAVSNLKNYIVRFSTLGTTMDGMLRVYLNNTSTNTRIVPLQLASFNTARKDHEFLFAAPISTTTTSFIIEIQQNSGTTFIDNLEVFEADITPVDINNEIRFEFNPSETSKTVLLDAKYLGVDSTNYDGTITLEPYSSKVLFKNGNISPLNASVTAPFINCFGGNTTATVSGSGGVVPYTGTGNFTAIAGSGTLRLSVASPVAGNYTSLNSSIGSISNSKSYLLMFSTLGTISGGSLRASLRQTNSPFVLLTPAQTKTFGNTRVDHEILFTSPATEINASFLIEILQTSGTVFIDNIAVFEANTAGKPISNNLYNSGQFETNISGINIISPTNNHVTALDSTSKIANTYYYPITDAAGSIAIAILVSRQPNALLVAAATQRVSTNGATIVNITATGGTAPYIGTGTFTGLQPGNYTYTVTDSLGCTAAVTITIVNRTPLSATASANTISCFGGNTFATVAAAGGLAPYTGTGNFTINAGKGSLKIAVPNPVTGNNTSVYAPIGAISSSKSYVLRLSTIGSTANGVVRARLRQLNSPFTTLTTVIAKSFGTSRVDHEFILTPISSEANAIFLIDILQTSGTTFIDNVAFFESTSAGIPVSDNLFTGGQFENGISNITAWSPTNNHLAEWDTTSKINNVYNYLVKDAAGAIVLSRIATSQPATLLQVSSTAGTISTIGGTTTVVVSATGGIPPYTGTGSFSNVVAGKYNYTVTDSAGCSNISSITISQPFAASAVAPAIACFGSNSTATVSATGGIAPYTGTGSFIINAGKGTLKVSAINPVVGDYTYLLASIGAVSSAKNYVLRFSTLGTTGNGILRARLRQTNAPQNGLSTVYTKSFGTTRGDYEFLFTAPTSEANAALMIDILQTAGTTYIDNVSFFEATPSALPVTDNLLSGGLFENGIGLFTAWTATNNDLTVWDTTSKISNIYNYAVKDLTGAFILTSVNTIQATSALTTTVVASPITVAGGSTTVQVTATGGAAPYTGTGTFSNVKAGTYTYSVTDSLGCAVAKTITITQPFSASASASAISCFGGTTTASVTALGGTAPYTGTGNFTISAGTGSLKLSTSSAVTGNYTSVYASIGTVSNSKNYLLRLSTFGTTANGLVRARLRQMNSPFNTLSAIISRTFGNGRVEHEFLFTAPATEANAAFLIDILQTSGTTYIDNIAIFEATSSGVLLSDNLFAGGHFENGISNVLTWSATNNHLAEWDNTSKINNVYYYLVKDAAGSSIMTSVATIASSSALTASSSAGVIAVSGGSTTVVVTATGGTAPYVGTGTFTNVKGGSYTYSVTDAIGCTVTTNLTINQPFGSSATASAINCFGGNTIASVTALGGTMPYTGTGNFSIKAGNSTLKLSASNPVTNNYNSVYASIGAISSSKTYLLRFTTLGSTLNGTVRARLRQFNPPYSTLSSLIVKSFGSSRVDHEFLFTAPTTEVNACFLIDVLQTSGTTYIDNIAVFEATPAGVPLSDNIFVGGQFENGISNVITWSPTNNHLAELDITSKITNTYNYPVKDAAGAFMLNTITTVQPLAPLVATATAGSITSVGGTTTVTISATGGTAPYRGTGTLTGVQAGNYNFTVIDASGCTSTASGVINVTSAARSSNANTLSSNSSGTNTLHSTIQPAEISSTLNANNKDLSIIVYPNPSENIFALKVVGASKELVYISVTATDGRQLYSTKGNSNSIYSFGNNFKPGMYFVKIYQGTQVIIQKVVKGKI